MKRSLLGLAAAAALGAGLLLFAGGCVPYAGYYGGTYGTYYGDPYGYYGDNYYDRPGGIILDFGYGRYGTFHHDYDHDHDFDHGHDYGHGRDHDHGH